MRNIFKRALAVLASAAMCGSMLLNFPNDTFNIDWSLPAFAAEDTSCTCTDKCAEGSVNSECAVCVADLTACIGMEEVDLGVDNWCVVDTEAGTVTIDGTLGGKTTATEEEVNSLVEAIKGYADSGNTTIIVTGSNPAMIEVGAFIMPAVSEALYRLTNETSDSPYCGTIDLILPDVTELVDSEFDNTLALNSITLPKVTTVGDGAFYATKYLKKLTFGSVITFVNEKSRGPFHMDGYEVGGCDLVLNCGQLQAEEKYKPNLETNIWFIGDWSGEYEWKSITLTHTEGTAATCIAQAVCSVCGESYGDIDADAHSYGDWVSNSDNTHTRTCTLCSTATEKDDCSGGTATCTTLAVCDICKTAYGELGRHTAEPTYAPNTGDSTQHDATYSCCGATVTEAHTMDIATGKCSACGADMTVVATVTDGTNTYYAVDADTLNQAVTAILETGSRTFTVELPADAEAEMITAIRRAICDTEGVADGSIHLTLKGVTTIPGTTNWDGVAFGPGDIYDEAGKIVDQELVTQLASINLPDVTEIGAQAFYFCENLVTVSAPKAQTIGAQALGYTALTSVEFPELTTIPTDMFSGTWTLSSAKFPKVTTIEQGGLLVGAKFTPENNPTPFPLELTAEGDITFNGSNHFNIAERNYTGKVDLVLCCDKKEAVTFHDDGTATWQVRDDLSYTFKSITFKHSYVDGKCESCGEDCAHTGGTATCTTLAVCDTCGVSYGAVDTTNHDSSVECENGFCPNGCYEPATLNAEGYYEIDNAGKLFWFAQQVNVKGNREIKGVLTANIDLENKPWTPIGETGEDNNNFRGVFDGQGHTIKGLYVEGSKNGVGFFGEVRTGTVKNFTIYGNVVVNTEIDYVGGVIGSICGVNGENNLERNGAIIQNITSFVNVTAKAHGIGMIGGFVGYANHQSLIEKCAWYGTFDAGEYRVDSGAGGFIGKIQDSTSEVTIRNCGAYGTIKTNYAGDYNNTPTIYMGGFLSFSNTNAKTTLENCLFAGRFERGENLTDQAFLGAFGTLRSVNAIKNCYYLGDDGLEAVHSDSNLKPGSDNVEITSVTGEELRNNTIATQLGDLWEQDVHYPIPKDTKAHSDSATYTYTDNGDGTHKKTCNECGYVADNEPHTIENHVCTDCGAMEIVVSFDAGDFEWKTGDKLYFCRVSGDNEWEEYAFTATVAGDGTVTWTPDRTLYWDGTGEHKLVVIYPDTGYVWDTWYIDEDQSTLENLRKNDHLNSIWSGNPTTDTITFNLKHRMAKVTVNYEAAEGVTVSKAEVYTLTQYVFFDVDTLERRNIAWEEGDDLWIHSYLNDGQFTAFVSPDAYAADGNFIKITLDDGTVYEVKMNKAVTFEEGAEYTYTVVITADGAYLTCADECTFEYTDNEDGLTHSKTCSKCGYVAASENHTLTYTTNGNTITESCSANCGHTGTATISATGKTYDGTAVELIVSKTGSLENTDIPVTLTKDGEAFTGEPVNAGAYTASVTLGGKTVSVDFTIAKAAAIITAAPTPNTLTYIGEAQYLISVGEAAGGTMVYSLTENGEYTTSIPQGTNAGDYTVWYYVQGDANHKDSAKDFVSVSIAKAPLTVTADAKIKTYGDEDPTLTYTAEGLLGGDTLFSALTGALTREEGENAGSYAITLGTLSADNYTISFEGADFTIMDETAPTGTILIKENSWNKFWNTTTFGIFCKDDVDVTITADGTGSGIAKVEYLLSDTTLDENNIPTEGWTEIFNNNGKYSFSIKTQNKVAVYVRITDECDNVTVINSDGIVVYEDSKAVDTEVTYTYKENSDKDIAVEFNGNTVNSIVCSEKVLAANSDYTVDYEFGKIVLKATYLDTLNADDYAFTISYNPMGVENSGVTDLTTTFIVKVEPTSIADATVTVNGTFTYDGNAKTPDPVVVLNGETLVKDRDYTVSYAENVNSGTATVTIQGIGNFKGTVTKTFTITCDHSHSEDKYSNNGDGTHDKVCSVCGYVENASETHSHVYTADETTDTIAHICICGDVEMSFTLNIPTATYGDSPMAVPHFTCSDTTYAGEFPVITIDGEENNFPTNAGTYEVIMTWSEVSVSGEYVIEKAEASVLTAPIGNTMIYNGEAQELITAGTAKGGTMLYALSEDGEYSAEISTATNAGDYTVWYYVQGDGVNYADSEKASIDVNISKAVPTVDMFTFILPADLVYDGTEKIPTVTLNDDIVGMGEFTIEYYSDGTYTEEPPVDAGEYTVYLVISEGDNYLGLDANRFSEWTFTIAPIDISDAEIKLIDELTYSGKEQTQTFSFFVNELLMPLDNCIVSGNTGTDAGEYTLTVEVISDNFTGTASAEWSIAKATPEVNIPTASELTYGQTLAESELSDSDWSWFNSSVVPTVDNDGYVAFMVITDGENYDYTNMEGYEIWESAPVLVRTIPVTVVKATPEVTPIIPEGEYIVGDALPEIGYESKISGIIEWLTELVNGLAEGENVLEWQFTPDDADNYEVVTGTAVVVAQTTTTTTTSTTTETTTSSTTTSATTETTTSSTTTSTTTETTTSSTSTSTTTETTTSSTTTSTTTETTTSSTTTSTTTETTTSSTTTSTTTEATTSSTTTSTTTETTTSSTTTSTATKTTTSSTTTSTTTEITTTSTSTSTTTETTTSSTTTSTTTETTTSSTTTSTTTETTTSSTTSSTTTVTTSSSTTTSTTTETTTSSTTTSTTTSSTTTSTTTETTTSSTTTSTTTETTSSSTTTSTTTETTTSSTSTFTTTETTTLSTSTSTTTETTSSTTTSTTTETTSSSTTTSTTTETTTSSTSTFTTTETTTLSTSTSTTTETTSSTTTSTTTETTSSSTSTSTTTETTSSTSTSTTTETTTSSTSTSTTTETTTSSTSTSTTTETTTSSTTTSTTTETTTSSTTTSTTTETTTSSTSTSTTTETTTSSTTTSTTTETTTSSTTTSTTTEITTSSTSTSTTTETTTSGTTTTLPQTGYSVIYNYIMLAAAAMMIFGIYAMAKSRKRDEE